MTDTITLTEKQAQAFHGLAKELAATHLISILQETRMSEAEEGELDELYDKLSSSCEDWKFLLGSLVQSAMRKGDFETKVICYEHEASAERYSTAVDEVVKLTGEPDDEVPVEFDNLRDDGSFDPFSMAVKVPATGKTLSVVVWVTPT